MHRERRESGFGKRVWKERNAGREGQGKRGTTPLFHKHHPHLDEKLGQAVSVFQHIGGNVLWVDNNPPPADFVIHPQCRLAVELEEKLITPQRWVFDAIVVEPVGSNDVVLL